ncbi:hypothetical protein FQA39_LY01000 [Lamprigera yunnana]|nr:hypothetical protein FQA39_LY01000 [Lamprigera yunnana]
MEYSSLDPYEQQLLQVFDSYDRDNKGSLDRDGLNQLCCGLHLEEEGIDLVQHLLCDSKKLRVTFVEFKDALLTLLGSIQKSQNNESQDDGSPDREVSPKYVYGTKKYGRRSRPKEDCAMMDGVNENINYTNKITYNTSVQRSNSQSDVLFSKKRKTTKLKRCTSFPGSRDFDFHKMSCEVTNGIDHQEFICTEEMLKQAWEKLGVGDDGYLNQTELVLVCDTIGLQRLAKGVLRQLSTKFQIDVNHKISFQELLEALQQDDTWSEVFNPTPPTVDDDSLDLSVTLTDSHFPDSDLKLIQHITLGPDGTGFINYEAILEMWENVGINSPKLLLQELGFVCSQINVTELASALEKEIKGVNDSKGFTNPHIVLLQAVLTLYRSEIRCLKNILEQMCAEREKLKNDIQEANNRATMLAQEVDDNHARMEQNTQQQVKLIEQRHSDIMKDITEQLTGEKEKVSLVNQNLKQKILCLEAEETQLRNDLHLAQEYSISVEKENHILNNRISELQQIKDALSKQLHILENDKHNYEYENQQSQIEPLLKQLSNLQIENSQLRDKNDEMLTEIESLNNQLCMMNNKGSSATVFHNLEQSMEENVSVICEGVGLGSKRRSDDSPSKALNVLGLGDSSPRLGKVRKCHKTKSENPEGLVTSSESGFDTELDGLDSSLSISINDYEEICRLQTRVMQLEETLKQHNISVPSANFSSRSEGNLNDMKIKQLTKRCVELQDLIVSVQSDLGKMLTPNPEQCACGHSGLAKQLHQKVTSVLQKENNENCEMAKNKNNKSTEIQALDTNLLEQIQKYVKENEELVIKCSELENCVELLRTEYETCEDYWSSKLEEERQMFEQEQSLSSEKLNELITKMAEYEADFRLPPIEEKYNLEKQFTDLEQEFDEYKEHAEFEIAEKAHEIADLKEKLVELKEKCTKEVGIQVIDLDEFTYQNNLENKMSNLSNRLIESTNLFSADTIPFEWNNSVNESGPNSVDILISNTETIQRDYVNPAYLWNKNRQSNSPNSVSTQILECNSNVNDEMPWHSTPQPFSIVSLPSTSADSASTVADNSTPSRLKKNRKHNKNSKVQRLINKDDNHKNSSNKQNHQWKGNEDQMVSLPIAFLHNLNSRLHHYEQRNRHLEVALKQQHYHAEQLIQRCRLQLRDEGYLLRKCQEELDNQKRICSKQWERLAKNDVVVKDLYFENSYLVANVQRLEKQCHIHTQFHSASNSI